MENKPQKEKSHIGSVQEAKDFLSQEKFTELFKRLDESTLNEMLEKSEESGKDSSDTIVHTSPSQTSRRSIFSKRIPLIVIIVGLILLPLALNKVFLSAELNSDDPLHYTEPIDDISCTDDALIVNNIKAAVPVEGRPEFSISYSWSEEDSDYPSVPHAISANYNDSEGNSLYGITLYRNETVPAADIPSGTNASNWFDSWKSETDAEICQVPVNTEHVSGFYIYPNEAAESDYNNYSYYFAVESADSISIYVLEGVCLDPERTAAFRSIMDECIQSLQITG